MIEQYWTILIPSGIYLQRDEGVHAPDGDLQMKKPSNVSFNKESWQRLFILIISSAYLYVFMEWLFHATKPSFMDVMTLGQKISVFLVTAMVFVGGGLPLWLILFLLSYIPLIRRFCSFLLALGLLIPTAFFAITTLLVVDNFTYTLSGLGVISTRGIVQRGLYGAAFIMVYVLWCRANLRFINRKGRKSSRTGNLRIQMRLTATLLGISTVVAIIHFGFNSAGSGYDVSAETKKLKSKPNIILIGSDGLAADRMSVYGYSRDTTPFLREFAKTSLVAENAFANSGNTSGSVISYFTSKVPTTTRVLYPPDMLRGSDSYQHLTAILRHQGYFNGQISFPHYVDAGTLNLQNGFEFVNGRYAEKRKYNLNLPFEETNYFFNVLSERFLDRVLHIFLIEEMQNPFAEVTSDLPAYSVSDRKRIVDALEILEKTKKPVLMHIHLMGTHGPRFKPKSPTYSKGKEQSEPWMVDFYDDAVIDFDRHVKQLIEGLDRSDKLENSIVVVHTDHYIKYETDKRIPLMFRFPSNQHAGVIKENAQLIDIAPTILDYLDLPVPGWMQGKSLLAFRNKPAPYRPVYSTAVRHMTQNEESQWIWDRSRAKPPFFQFAYFQAIICDRWYRLDFEDGTWSTGSVENHTQPCAEEGFPNESDVMNTMLDRLEKDNFDVSTLRRTRPDSSGRSASMPNAKTSR